MFIETPLFGNTLNGKTNLSSVQWQAAREASMKSNFEIKKNGWDSFRGGMGCGLKFNDAANKNLELVK